METLKEIYNYRTMISSLVRRELRGKYEKSVLGFLWAFLGPMFQILIYGIVFTVVFHNNMPNYYIFLMTGILPWTFFSDSLGQGTGAIVYNAEMVKKIYFPREVMVIGEVNAKLVNMLLSFIVMAFFLLFSGVGFSVHIVLLPLVILIEYMIALGMALLAAATTVYLRDLEYVVNVILMAWIWGTPIMYTADSITNPLYLTLLRLNPMTGTIGAYQNIFYFHKWPTVRSLLYPFCFGVLILIIGFVVFGKLKKRFSEEL